MYYYLKNKYNSNQINETDVVRLISDAKQLITRNNKNCFILHVLVDKYIIDGIVNLFGSLTKAGHKFVKMYQTGFISGYLFMILIMLALILLTQGYWVS